MTMSLFPDLVPEDDVPRRRAASEPTWILQDGTWTLLRSTGRTINDVPQWHRIKASLGTGAFVAECGHVGSIVLADIAQGAKIGACTGCLTS